MQKATYMNYVALSFTFSCVSWLLLIQWYQAYQLLRDAEKQKQKLIVSSIKT